MYQLAIHIYDTDKIHLVDTKGSFDTCKFVIEKFVKEYVAKVDKETYIPHTYSPLEIPNGFFVQLYEDNANCFTLCTKNVKEVEVLGWVYNTKEALSTIHKLLDFYICRIEDDEHPVVNSKAELVELSEHIEESHCLYTDVINELRNRVF